MSVIVIQFITLDGIVSDPDGSGGTPSGGWAFRHGRETWQMFSRLWPTRTDPFSMRMNAMSKLVASRTLTDTSAWVNSQVLKGDLAEAVRQEARDVVVAGSLSVVRALMAEDLIDEYRLLTFPTVVGTGDPLFPAGGPPAYLELQAAEKAGPAVLTRYLKER